MFSSNLFPELPSSPNVYFPPNFLLDHENDSASCFNYHLNYSDPFVSGDCFQYNYSSLSPPSPAIENVTTIDQDINKQQLQFSEEPVISCSKKKTRVSNKDGHSKIYTARGPRDRRVRLSIDISRKFFCLQDLLGFDKASKTLDWLFTKCKTAIKELVEETNHCSSSTATYQSKMSFLEAIMGGKGGDKSKKKSEHKFDGKRKQITQRPKGGFQDNPARDQSRAVARARARERVREKMRIKMLDDELKTLLHDDFYYQNFKPNAGENHRVISANPAAW